MRLLRRRASLISRESCQSTILLDWPESQLQMSLANQTHSSLKCSWWYRWRTCCSWLEAPSGPPCCLFSDGLRWSEKCYRRGIGKRWGISRYRRSPSASRLVFDVRLGWSDCSYAGIPSEIATGNWLIPATRCPCPESKICKSPVSRRRLLRGNLWAWSELKIWWPVTPRLHCHCRICRTPTFPPYFSQSE